MLPQPKLIDTGRTRDNATWWMVDEPYTFGNITVPRGFESDLSTVPGIFRWWIKPDYRKGMAAALLHDWLLNQNDPRANDVYAAAIHQSGIGRIKAWIMIKFVRIWTV